MTATIVERVMDNTRVSEAEERKREKEAKTRMLLDIQTLVSHLDTDQSGYVMEDQLEAELQNKHGALYNLLCKCDLPRGMSAKELVMLLDEDGDSQVNYEE